jgi:hypothetical protein
MTVIELPDEQAAAESESDRAGRHNRSLGHYMRITPPERALQWSEERPSQGPLGRRSRNRTISAPPALRFDRNSLISAPPDLKSITGSHI